MEALVDREDDARIGAGSMASDASLVANIPGLNPALAYAFYWMTANIIKVIDNKLSPFIETIHKHTAYL